MADYDVVKVVDERDTPARYVIKNWRTVKDRAGYEVEIEAGSRQVSLEQLEQEKARYQAQLDEVQAKIDAIKAL